MSISKRSAVLAGLMALAGTVSAEVYSVASLANPTDNSGGSARALGIGGAFVGVADDSSALLWNPSGLSGLKKMEMALHHNSWLGGIIQETAVMALPMGPLGNFGASINYVGYGSIEGYDSSGTQVSSYSANRYGLGLGWGKEVLPGLSAGVGLKGAMRNMPTGSSSDVSGDLGVLWQPMKELRLGMALSNLGSSVAGYSQAAALRGGGSYLMKFSSNHQLLLAASAAFEPSGVNRIQLGVEDTLHSFLALRLGYQFNLADTQIQGLTGLSAGLGVTYNSFGLDYAYLPFGELGTSQRVSLSYKFDHPRTTNDASRD